MVRPINQETTAIGKVACYILRSKRRGHAMLCGPHREDPRSIRMLEDKQMWARVFIVVSARRSRPGRVTRLVIDWFQ